MWEVALGSKGSHNTSTMSAHHFAGFALPKVLQADVEMVDQRIELIGKPCQMGPCHIESWRVHLPQLKPPLDACLDAQRFQQLRGILTELSMQLPLACLNRSLAKVDFQRVGLQGLQQLHVEQDAAGRLALLGLYIDANHVAPVGCRLALAALGPDRLQIVFEDVHIFGSFPTTSVMLPIRLQQGLFAEGIVAHWPNSWLVPPATLFASELMPRVGWKIPDSQQVRLTQMQLQSGTISVTLTQKMLQDDSQEILALSAEDLLAAQYIRQHAVQFSQAEALLLQNKVDAAYAEYHKASLQQPSNAWIKQRLLKLGVMHSQWSAATERLAHTMLDTPEFEMQARLALAALALREHNTQLAAVHYGYLSQRTAMQASWLHAAARVAQASCLRHKNPDAALEILAQVRQDKMRQAWVAPVEFQIFTARKQTQHAHAALETWLAHVEDGPYAKHLRKTLVRDYLKTQTHLDKAHQHLDALIQEQPDVLEHWQHQLQLWTQQENWLAAIEALKQIARIHAQNQDLEAASECLLQIAKWAQTYLSSFSMAEKSLHAIFEMVPVYPAATWMLAQLYDRQHRRQNAHALYGQLLDWVEAHDAQAIHAAGISDAQIAQSYFRKSALTEALPRTPKPIDDEQISEKIIQWLEKSLSYQSDAEDVQDALLAKLMEKNRIQNVIERCLQWGQAQEDVQRREFLYKQAADAAYRLEPQSEQDSAWLVQIFTQAPTDEVIWQKLVRNLLPKGHTKQLIELLQRAIGATADPKQRAKWRWHAVELYIGSSSLQDAVVLQKLLASVVQDDPEHAQASKMLAQKQQEMISKTQADPAETVAVQASSDPVTQVTQETQETQDLAYWVERLSQAMRTSPIGQIQEALLQAQENMQPDDRFTLILHFVRFSFVANEIHVMRETLQYAHYLVTEYTLDVPQAQNKMQTLLAGYPELFYEQQVWDLLQALQMPQAQAIWLEKSLKLHPVPDDGRFEQCIDLHLAIGMSQKAWQICANLMSTHPQYDVTWRKGLEVALAHPEHKAPELVFEAWCQKRVGTQKAILLEAYAAYLQAHQNQAGACHLLWQAAQITQDTQKQCGYLQTLAQTLDPKQDANWLRDVLQRHLSLTHSDDIRAQLLRDLARLYEVHLQAPAKAAEMLMRLPNLTLTEQQWLTSLQIQSAHWNLVLSMPIDVLATQTTEDLLKTLHHVEQCTDWHVIAPVAELIWQRAENVRATWQSLAKIYHAHEKYQDLAKVYRNLLNTSRHNVADTLYLQLAEVLACMQNGLSDTSQAIKCLEQLDLSGFEADQDIADLVHALARKLPTWTPQSRRVETQNATLQQEDKDPINSDVRESWEKVIIQALQVGDLEKATRWSQHRIKQKDAQSHARLLQIWVENVEITDAKIFVQSCEKRLDAHNYQAFYQLWLQACTQAGHLDWLRKELFEYPPAQRDVQWAQFGFQLAKLTDDLDLEVQSAQYALQDTITEDALDLWRTRLAHAFFKQDKTSEALALLASVWSQGDGKRMYQDAFQIWSTQLLQGQDTQALQQGLQKRCAMLKPSAQEDLLCWLVPKWGARMVVPRDVVEMLQTQWHRNPLGKAYQCLKDLFQKEPLVWGEMLAKRAQDTELEPYVAQGFLQKAFDLGQKYGDTPLGFDVAQMLLAQDQHAVQAKEFCVAHALKTGIYPDNDLALQVVIDVVAAQYPAELGHYRAQSARWHEQNCLEQQIDKLHAQCTDPQRRWQDQIQLAIAYEYTQKFAQALQVWIDVFSQHVSQRAWLAHAYDIALLHKQTVLRAEIIAQTSRILTEDPGFGAQEASVCWQALRLVAGIHNAYQHVDLQHASRLYQQHSDWRYWSLWVDDVLDVLYDKQRRQDLEPWLMWAQQRDIGTKKEHANRLLRQALWLQTHRQETQQAHQLLKQARDYQPASGMIQAHLGLSYWKQDKIEQARTLLQTSLQQGAGALTEPAMLTLLDCLQVEDKIEQALAHCHAWRSDDALEISETTKQKLFEKSSDYLCALNQWGTAEVMWQTKLASEKNVERQVQIHKNLADIALQQDAYTRAQHYLDAAKAYAEHDPEVARLRIQAYAAQHMWQQVADEYLKQAQHTDDLQLQVQHWMDAATCFEQHLDQSAKATALLEKACQARPRDAALLQRLMDHYTSSENVEKKLLTAERLLAMFSKDHFDADFYMMMAQDYRQIDLVRAEKMAALAYQQEPNHPDRQSFYRTLLIENQNWPMFFNMEKTWIQSVKDTQEFAQRAAFFGEMRLQEASDLVEAITFLKLAVEAMPEALVYQKQLASALARDRQYHPEAVTLYQKVLRHTPMDTDILRVLARLTGQQEHTDRAYGYYACLLCLLPNDEEASDYVLACRKARKQTISVKQENRAKVLIEQTVPSKVQPVLACIRASLEKSEAGVEPTPTAMPWFGHDIEELLTVLIDAPGDATTKQRDRSDVLIRTEGALEMFVYAQSHNYFQLKKDAGLAFE